MIQYKIVCLILLATIATPWCLKTTVNFTAGVDKVDYSIDGTLIAVTSITNNQVTIYDTINFFLLHTYTPSSGTATVARFSRDNANLVVGTTNGRYHVLDLASNPFSATFSHTYMPQANDDQIVDLAINYDNTKILLCFTNDNDLSVVTNWATSGS